MPIDVNRGLAKDSRGNMLWDTKDVLVDTEFGPFLERQLVGQPNGGVIHRTGPGGMAVYMYNDDPGVFYNERGVKVPESIAAAAGFDVDTLGKAQRRKLAMIAAKEQVDEQFSHLPSARVIAERGEYREVEIAVGHYQIQFVESDGTGSPLTTLPLTRKVADKMFTDLAGPESPEGVKDA